MRPWSRHDRAVGLGPAARVLAGLAVVATLACAAGGRTGTPARSAKPGLRLTTGLPGAAFNPLGHGIADAFTRALPELSVTIVPSSGSIDNIEALQRGSADLGLAFTDLAYMAFAGEGDYDGRALTELRGIAVLQLTPVHVVLRPGLRASTVSQLRGRRIALGPHGSGTALTAELLLKAFGLSTADVSAVYLPFMEAAQQLLDGSIDAAFVSAGHPAAAVELATRRGARLLDVSGPAVEQLRAEYPFLKVARIPGATYHAHADPIHTVGVDAMLLCRAGLDEALVYRLTDAFFDALPSLSSRLTSLKSLDFSRAPATSIPLHAGAARYYRERELFR